MIHARHFALHDENIPSVKPAAPESVNENLREATEEFQRQMITRALEQNNRSWAACARRWKWTSPTCTGWRSVWD